MLRSGCKDYTQNNTQEVGNEWHSLRPSLSIIPGVQVREVVRNPRMMGTAENMVLSPLTYFPKAQHPGNPFG